ncbi:type II secretion system protein GspL [Janthinobacterium agaricidamnosum]|uniref:General secretion pathway L family protein n=1 Tax=Janthinobacterium agaricidamnosum NBRC 102515 = DSM 9628 TaxID=1349767 RepID=W0VE95_9BURK|nr:type II secretion system protein GspL [Janthinobacterium agaricidamnosum]CDG85657.1 general secretion pathway L family protein [Janthinobacterium agaricidamnosum NBRC 102515 = DSM 9628]
MTTLYLRHPAKASIDNVALCQFALAGDGGNLLQQGAAALGSLGELIAGARRVVLLLAAADVTLLRLKTPPLSGARLKAALPGLVEEHILGEPGDCVLAATLPDAEGLRTVAVVQRAWLDVLVKALLAQGAHAISVLPAQLCVPLPVGGLAAVLQLSNSGLDLTLRLTPSEGLGLSLPAQPQAALQVLRGMAGDAPLTVYVPAAQAAEYQQLALEVSGVTVDSDHWAHWIAASKTAGPDLFAALGSAGAPSRTWQTWRWPLRLAVLLAIVNIAGLNIEWSRLKRDAATVKTSMTQIFKAAYPNETPLYPAEQMRRNIAAARLLSGQVGADEFTSISAALGEALGSLANRGVIASLEYRDHALTVKLKPDMVDAGALAQARSLLAERKLALKETGPGVWQIRAASPNSGAQS